MKLIDNTSDISKFGYVPQASRDMISTHTSHIIHFINYSIICALIGVFGIFSNIINMIVFYRQGFTTNTNISFFALAVSDMFCLITTQWIGIALNPYIKAADIEYILDEIEYLSGGWLHVCFGRITSWITVFITAERCLGITLPLKVKQIITLRRTTIAMCAIFFLNLASLIPEHSFTYLDWKFVRERNRTLFGIVYTSYADQMTGVTHILTSVSGMMSFISVILLTTFLVSSLQRKSKWRMKATGGADNSDSRSSRDKKTMKMIIMIATVLIICYTPGTAVALVTAFEPEFMVQHAFANSFFSFWSIAFVFDTINSSVNIFLYYRMSTKYRQTFNKLFNRCLKDELSSTVD